MEQVKFTADSWHVSLVFTRVVMKEKEEEKKKKKK